ncbi:hypothetical protein BDQ17DRAFT_1360397 [Cyathus striatus]|nr:hypothetical protein BDQ17DRAFT_1360397 [Cyathus striatus]
MVLHTSEPLVVTFIITTGNLLLAWYLHSTSSVKPNNGTVFQRGASKLFTFFVFCAGCANVMNFYNRIEKIDFAPLLVQHIIDTEASFNLLIASMYLLSAFLNFSSAKKSIVFSNNRQCECCGGRGLLPLHQQLVHPQTSTSASEKL